MLKAIETVYNGYRFRSRLEARWAVFFDTLGIKYEYEKQGYDLDGIWYLPDFWLPEHQCYIEIKGQEPTEEENEKASRLAETSKHNVYIFFDIPPHDMDISDTDEKGGHVFFGDEGWDNAQLWCECPTCGKLGIKFCGYADRLCKCSNGNKEYNASSHHLKAAYAKARQARFEHGKTPSPKFKKDFVSYAQREAKKYQAAKSIYLAGKIQKDCWRHSIVKGLRGEFSGGEYDAREIMPPDEEWPVLQKAVLDTLNYTGPYFISCDHGCFHQSPHAIGSPSGPYGADDQDEDFDENEETKWRKSAIQWCLNAIKRSDIVFAWIEDTTCYGTLAELGYAKALGKTIWIASNDELLTQKDLWFACNMADEIFLHYSLNPKFALETLIKKASLIKS